MSSILIEDASTLAFQEINDDGGLSIIGKSDENNIAIIKGDGNDVVIGGTKGGSISTDAGDDVIIARDGTFFLDAGKGNDVVLGGEGVNFIKGGDGADILIGGNGTDSNDIDVIRGGKGSDIMIGGDGDDVFKFNVTDFEANETDFILDFTEDEDLIQIEDATSVEYNSSTGIVSINGKNAIFLDTDLDITAQDSDGDGTWELM